MESITRMRLLAAAGFKSPSIRQFKPLINDLAQFSINLGFNRSVTARANNARTLANEGLVLVGPLDHLLEA
jgi:hypothetical protein